MSASLAPSAFLQDQPVQCSMGPVAPSTGLLRRFRSALQADEFEPFFQPMVDLASLSPCGFEVLARWMGSRQPAVGPDIFIPLAESAGLLPVLTERLLRTACREAVRWPEHLTLAVNISPRQLLDPALPEFVRRIVEPSGFPLSRLELEITEQGLPGRLSQAAAVAGKLKDLGICLVMDDYGAGASDIQRLEALPFDKIKLDRSLIGALDETPASGRRLEVVIALAAERGMGVVAEGIETQAQAEIMRRIQCKIAQGWLFGRPVRGDDVPSVLIPETAG